MYSKSSHCNVSKLSDYYKIARSVTLLSLRKCMQLHHFIPWNLLSQNLLVTYLTTKWSSQTSPISFLVSVKGGMSLQNGMWHGLRNDIIMRNLIYGKWSMRTSLPRLFWRQFEGTIALPVHLLLLLRWLSTELWAVSSSTCFKLDKQTWRR